MLLTEFDPSSRAVIDPEMCVHPVEGLPEIAVSCFSHHLFEAVLAFFQPERICGVGGANGKAPVYAVDYRGRRIAFYESRVGEPACIGDFEDLIAMGLKKLILFGNCGVLDRSVEDCGIIIPTRAIRDEGSSYHYAAAADFIDVNRKYRDVFHQVLADCGCPYVEGTTWTTDAPYRETAEKVRRRKAQGAICVEMECAGMQAVADFRGVDFFQFFYAGDNLDHSQWQPRSLSGHVRLDDKSKIALLAFELAAKL